MKLLRLLILPCLFAAAPTLGVLLWAITPDTRPLVEGQLTVTRWIPGSGKTQVTVGPQTPHWTPEKSISKHLVHAVLVSEDARFYHHFGIDCVEIWKSIHTNISTGAYTRGASTITQQVVKMASLYRDKTLWRKLREVLGAIYLERQLDKTQILEWYLNLANFGHGAYGVDNAAQLYFAKPAEQLSVSESVHLALVLPSPNTWSKGLKDQDLQEQQRKRFESILTQMKKMNFINESLWDQAIFQGNFGSPIHL
ncbi:MAG: transglycosylase domain-containing protein [Zetaproteobacteria bacterium]|nr:transglycosylase domain-containing protein [Zetaproteobacteria bacterium]